jgi:hypothetical protein
MYNLAKFCEDLLAIFDYKGLLSVVWRRSDPICWESLFLYCGLTIHQIFAAVWLNYQSNPTMRQPLKAVTEVEERKPQYISS